MIAWVSELFEDVLGWIRGVQFACFVFSGMADKFRVVALVR